MKKNIVRIISKGLWLSLIIITLNIAVYYSVNKKEKTLEDKSIDYIINNQEKVELGKKEKINNKKIINYEMILEIPKINLKKGILNKNNQDNNVDKNVTILNYSSYPDQEGNIYIAAHSGTGLNAYFNDLSKLKLNDEAILYYKNNKYLYYVNEIKEISKESKSSILTTSNDNLVLITCSQKNKNKYLIIILNKNKKAELN